MSKIYVANVTKQALTFNYRLPVEPAEEDAKKSGQVQWGRALQEQIPPGGQVVLAAGRDFSDYDAKVLFEHHNRLFGAIPANQYKRGFVGLLWSNKPIDVEKIAEGIAGNDEAALARAEQVQDDTAAAALKAEQKRAAEAGTAQPKRVELEVIPEGTRGVPADTAGRGSEAVADGNRPKNPDTRGK